MPTSRQRRAPARKDRRTRPEEAPYTRLARGVIADEDFGRLYRRAMWSFHRAPTPQVGDEGVPAADAAAARGLEWFLFGLTLPPQHLTPAEMWIERESEARGWAATTRREFLTLTTSQYGLFRIEHGLGDSYFTMVDLTQGGRYIGWNVAAVPDVEPGAVVAGWVFPAVETSPAMPGSTSQRRSVVISPGSSVLPGDVVSMLESSGRLSTLTALEVEDALGATLDWLAEPSSAVRARLILDEFLEDVTNAGVRASHLAAELDAAASPATVVMRVIDELDPITSIEPMVIMALCSMVWITRQAKSGVALRTVQRRAERWTKELQRLLDGGKVEEHEAGKQQVPDSASQLTKHEITRLRALPQEAGRVWSAEQRILEVPAQGPDRRGYFPECVAVIDAPQGQHVLALEPVPANEPDRALLRTVVGAMTSPRVGTARRPSSVKVRSEHAAARLRTLQRIGVDVRVEYIDASLEDAWAALTVRAATAGVASLLPLEPFTSTGYLAAGSTPAQLRDFFVAATELHALAPWRTADGNRPFGIQPNGRLWPAVPGALAPDEGLIAAMMGANAREFHLRVCLDDDALEELLLGEDVRESERGSTLTLEFHDEEEVAPEVIAETRQHQLAIPSRQAIPIAHRTQPSTPARLAAGEELSLLAAVLRVIAAFLRLHGRQIAATSGEIVRDIDMGAHGHFEVRVAPKLDEEDD